MHRIKPPHPAPCIFLQESWIHKETADDAGHGRRREAELAGLIARAQNSGRKGARRGTARRRARTPPRTRGPRAKTGPPWGTRPAAPQEERNKVPAGPPRTGRAPRPPSPPGRIWQLPGRGPASTGPARTTQAETALAAATTTSSRRPAGYARSPHCAASPAATRKPADHYPIGAVPVPRAANRGRAQAP